MGFQHHPAERGSCSFSSFPPHGPYSQMAVFFFDVDSVDAHTRLLLTDPEGRAGEVLGTTENSRQAHFFPKKQGGTPPRGGGDGTRENPQESFLWVPFAPKSSPKKLPGAFRADKKAGSQQAGTPPPRGVFRVKSKKKKNPVHPAPWGGGWGRRTLKQKLGPRICFHGCLLLLSGLFLGSPFPAVVPPQRIIFKLFFPAFEVGIQSSCARKRMGLRLFVSAS